MKRICLALCGAAGLLALLIAGCSVDRPSHPKIDTDQPTGKEIAANYVAIGNSLTAGFMDAGLHYKGQVNSYPSLVAWRLGYVVQWPQLDPNFSQPWVAEPGLGSSGTGDPAQVASTLYWSLPDSTIAYLTTPASEVANLLEGLAEPVPYENLGVPGALTVDVNTRLTSTTSTEGPVPEPLTNPFFDSILRNPSFGNVTMLGQAAGKTPTLVTLWIGSSDVLGGATSGEPEVGVNITPPDLFRDLYEALVAELDRRIYARSGIHPTVVVANVPGVAAAPYFISVADWEANLGPVPPTEEENVQLIRFPALSVVLDPGFTPPLGAQYTLDADEVNLIAATLTAYNDHIADIASTHGFELVDAKGILENLVPPQNTHPYFLLKGGMEPALVARATLFSLDGIHPNNRGNLLIANNFLAAINAALGLSGPNAYGPLSAPISEWDPTYGRNGGLAAAAGEGLPPSLQATEAMAAIFRR